MASCIRFPDCMPCSGASSALCVAEPVEERAGGRDTETHLKSTELAPERADQETLVRVQNLFESKPIPSPSSSPQLKISKQPSDRRSSILSSVHTSLGLKLVEKEMSISGGSAENRRDPISLEPLGSHVFCFTCSTASGEGPVVRYNAVTLAAYMVATGDFTEPTTRAPLTEAQLKELDGIAQAVNRPGSKQCQKARNLNPAPQFMKDLPESCTESPGTCDRVWCAWVAHREGRASSYAEAKSRRDLLEGLERCLGEVLCEMLEVVDEATDGDVVPLVSKFHDFDHYLGQFGSTDPQLARTCLVQYVELSLGPRNKRRSDQLGLLRVLLDFLDDKITSTSKLIESNRS